VLFRSQMQHQHAPSYLPSPSYLSSKLHAINTDDFKPPPNPTKQFTDIFIEAVNSYEAPLPQHKEHRLRDSRKCGSLAGCITKPADGSCFRACARCKSTNYCSVTCQKSSWSFHKAVECTTILERQESTLAMYKAENPIAFHDDATLAAAIHESLKITRHQPVAAFKLLEYVSTAADMTFEFPYDAWTEICKTLFQTVVKIEDIRRLEELLKVTDILEERRVFQRGEDAVLHKKLQGVVDSVEKLNALVKHLLPFVKLIRGKGHATVDFKNDAELVNYVYEQTREKSGAPVYKKIPWFLSVVDDCCTNFSLEGETDELDANEETKRCDEVREICGKAWAEYYRFTENDEEKSDEDCASSGRMEEFIRRFRS